MENPTLLSNNIFVYCLVNSRCITPYGNLLQNFNPAEVTQESLRLQRKTNELLKTLISEVRKTNELLEKRPVCAWWAVDYQLDATKTHQSALWYSYNIRGSSFSPEQSCVQLSLLMLSITQLFMTITFFSVSVTKSLLLWSVCYLW